MKDYLQRDHQVRRGMLRYTSDKPDRRGEERGRERWTMVRHADGRRSLQAYAEIDDRPSVLRFSQLNLNPDWSPADAAVRISVGDAFTGSGWFRFGDGFVECEVNTAAEGRVSQRLATDGPVRFFGSHAIQNDGWATQVVDRSRPGEVQAVPVYLSSPDHRGATGPMACRVDANIVFDGEERISIAAGDFDAWHFRFVSVSGMAGEHPDYEVWTSTDGDFIFLQGQVGGYMQTRYELVELDNG